MLMSLPPLAAWEYSPEYQPGSFEAELIAMLEPREWVNSLRQSPQLWVCRTGLILATL